MSIRALRVSDLCGEWSAYVSSDDLLVRFKIDPAGQQKGGLAVLVFGPARASMVMKFHFDSVDMPDTEMAVRATEVSTNRMILLLGGLGSVWRDGSAEIDLNVALLDAAGKPPMWRHRATARRQRLPSSYIRELEATSDLAAASGGL
jgi:hypothetical protein